MNKILLIIRREFLTRVRKTSFIVLTLLMPFLFVGIIATPVLLSRIGNDETARQIALIDPTGRYAAAFKPDNVQHFFHFCCDSAFRHSGNFKRIGDIARSRARCK